MLLRCGLCFYLWETNCSGAIDSMNERKTEIWSWIGWGGWSHLSLSYEGDFLFSDCMKVMTDNNKQDIEIYKGKWAVSQAACPEGMIQKIILFCSKSHTILITIRYCLSILATYMIYDSQYAKGWCKRKM